MAKEKSVDKTIQDLRKTIEEGKVVFGTKETLDLIKKGKTTKVFLSSNVSEETKKDIEYYKDISGFSIMYLDVPNDELGTICKKPFSISVLCEKNE